MQVDLRSDTVTKPTAEMLKAMQNAKVGDDVFGEDPSVIALEQKVAKIFGKEAALFCPSGTMTNQIAVKLHTQPGDEVICDQTAHIYNYEGGGLAFNSGVSSRLLSGNLGRFTVDQVVDQINPDDIHFPNTSLISIENTVNKGGGSVWDMDEIEDISILAKQNQLAMHLDGARVFNALAVSRDNPEELGAWFDTIS
ncbi:MAG: threonine aldolase family protein, partial [Reichenbachiella sp.]